MFLRLLLFCGVVAAVPSGTWGTSAVIEKILQGRFDDDVVVRVSFWSKYGSQLYVVRNEQIVDDFSIPHAHCLGSKVLCESVFYTAVFCRKTGLHWNCPDRVADGISTSLLLLWVPPTGDAHVWYSVTEVLQ